MTNGLAFYHEHLPHYNDFVAATKIQREHYTPLHKLFWYQTTGLALKGKEINLGDIREDTRMHILLPLKSGKSKANYKLVTRKFAEEMQLEVSTPSSLHPEQLVGRMIKVSTGKNKYEFRENFGYLHDDLVQFDEAHSILSDKDPMTREIRNYCKLGLDSPGRNFVYKRLTENEKKNALAYFAQAAAQFYFQPLVLDELIVLDGFMRRFTFPYIELPRTEDDASSEYLARIRGTGNAEQGTERFAAHLKRIKTLVGNWEFMPQAEESIARHNADLVACGRNRSKQAATWCDIMEWSFGNQLVKLSAILAGAHGSVRVEEYHTHLAFMDYYEFLDGMFNFLEKKVIGSFDYGEAWKGAAGKAAHCLSFLHEQGALSQETSEVSVKEFTDYIVGVYGLQERQAERKLKWFREQHWVDGGQQGQHGSKVWLAFTPAMKLEGRQERQGRNGGVWLLG